MTNSSSPPPSSQQELRERISAAIDQFEGKLHSEKIKLILSATAPQQGEAGVHQLPEPGNWNGFGKYSLSFSFDGGGLNINIGGYGAGDGNGVFYFRDDELQYEQDDESGSQFRWVHTANSDLIELRDKLIEVFLLAQSPAPDATVREKVARIIDPEGWDIEGAESDYARLCRRESLAKADAILAVLSQPQPIDAGEGSWRSMDTAPTDDTMVRLLVDYSGDEGDHPLEDDTIAWTIGFNSDSNTGEQDGWKFVGWCWTHDHWVTGRGKPIGWLPWNNPRTPDETPRSDGGQER